MGTILKINRFIKITNMIQNCIINSKWLKEFSIYPLNYNTKELENYIKLAEVIWLLPIVGHDWYDELVEQVKNDSLTEANSTALVEAIYPMLGFAIAYEALPMTWANVTEVGIVKGHSDNSESLSLKDLTLLQQHVRTQLEARKNYLITWLDEHYESFPLYHPTNCNCNTCCNSKGLNLPNPNFLIYGLPKKDTNLK